MVATIARMGCHNIKRLLMNVHVDDGDDGKRMLM